MQGCNGDKVHIDSVMNRNNFFNSKFTIFLNILNIDKEIVSFDTLDKCFFDDFEMGLNWYETLVLGCGLGMQRFIVDYMPTFTSQSSETTIACKLI